MAPRRCLLLLAVPTPPAAGHGVMTLPSPRQRATGNAALPPSLSVAVANGDSTHNAWFTNNVNPDGDPARIEIPGNATNCAPDMHPGMSPARCRAGKKPWFAPGTAPILSPCGVAGGGPPCGVEGAWKCDSKSDLFGTDARSLPPTARSVWRRGAAARVAWSIQANHMGGYGYRLCPAGAELTESCFQQHHLAFAGSTSTIHWINGTEVEIPLVTTVTGTSPPGSMWARNPIPGDNGQNPIFPAPCVGCETCAGRPGVQDPSGCKRLSLHDFSIVDRVAVPDSLTPGDYVLSWRWDCEVNPQVWTNCADVTIQ